MDYQKHPVDTLKVNSQGTLKLLEYAKDHKSIFLFASSSEIYGNSQMIPTPEDYYGNVNPIGIRACYQESKRFAETACIAYKNNYKVDVRIARIFNTYGERLRPDGIYGRVITRFIAQALTDKGITIHGDGNQTRSFCYVSDTCNALTKILNRKETSGMAINIGYPVEISILELANLILEMTNSKSKINFIKRLKDDPDRRCPFIGTAEKVLDWKPEISLIEGLQNTIKWVKYFIDNY
jgi:UDP-glucuronate decarboxylase